MTAAVAPVRAHRFVFIAGLHRSGTSLLFQCLRDHPEISAFRDTGVPEDEGQHLQTVYPRAAQWGGPGTFGFHPEAHMTEASPLVTDGNRKELFAQWAPYWDLSRGVLLEKSPQNLVQTRFFQAMFPDSWFIVITRHPVAVAYATQRWNRASLYSLLEHWCRCHELFEEDRPHLRRAFVLRYEDLASDPVAALAGVYRFLDLEPQPASIRVRDDVNETYFRRWRDARTRVVSRPYIEHLALTFEARVNTFQYSLARLSDGEAAAVPSAGAALRQNASRVHQVAGAVRQTAFTSYKRLRNRAMAALGRSRRRRSAVH